LRQSPARRYTVYILTVAEFTATWRRVELKERSAAQEHFIDLCNVFEHPTPAAGDPAGATCCFEKGISKHGGPQDQPLRLTAALSHCPPMR